jgi:cobalt-precorrin 5A hydrolase
MWMEVAIGIGCDRGAALGTLEAALAEALARVGPVDVRWLATIDRKGDEPAILALAAARRWPLVIYPATALACIEVPNPSAQVLRHLGVPAVAEAAALLAAGAEIGDLLLEKYKFRGEDAKHVTLSVAAWRR